MPRKKKAVRPGLTHGQILKDIQLDYTALKPFVKHDVGVELDILERWLCGVPPCVEDFGVSPVPSNLYELTQAVSLICDKRGIEPEPFCDLGQALIASVRPDEEGWAGPKPSKKRVVTAFRKARTLYDRVVTLLIEEARAETEQKDAEAMPALRRAERLAYQSYEYAIGQKPKLADTTDNEVYNWLKENGTEGDYELPSPETWKRQVRAGRKCHRTQKNTPRAGRDGRSIIKTDQVQSLSEISSQYDHEAD